MTGHITSTVVDRIMTIRIDREDKRNAIDREMADQLRRCWEDFNSSTALVAVITGRDEAFSAGADLSGSPSGPGEGWRIHQAVPGVLVDVEKPVISAVAGWCVGVGLYLAQATDLIVAAENARFVYPEPKIGMGGSWVPTGTAARIPLKVAMELALVCEPLSADRAYSVGMVNELVPVGHQTERALQLARKIASHSPSAIRHIKRHVQAHGPQAQADLACNLPDRIAVLRNAEEQAEGIAAFQEGRAPDFSRFSGVGKQYDEVR